MASDCVRARVDDSNSNDQETNLPNATPADVTLAFSTGLDFTTICLETPNFHPTTSDDP